MVFLKGAILIVAATLCLSPAVSADCASGQWGCGDGLCVAMTQVCDGDLDCNDGDDEVLENCRDSERPLLGLILFCSLGWSRQHETICPEACRLWPDICYYALAAEHGAPNTCILPEIPLIGEYDIENITPRGDEPADFSLVYSCPRGYFLVGENPRCANGNWTSAFPSCKRFCKLNRHPSVTYLCKPTDPTILSGKRICNKYEPSGAEVSPQCNDNYHSSVLTDMNCIGGSWDYTATCEPECGTLTPEGETLIINGVSAERGELPWHAGIYDKRFTPFRQICGGSLASTTVVISAAHCFWNDVEHVLPAKYFAIGVGKIYRPRNYEEGGQRSEVSDIKIPPRFSGAGSNFQDDIAILILVTPVVLTKFVKPVCIDLTERFDERQLQPGNVGKVAGWGLTSEDGNASPVLKVTELPYVDVEQCIADLPFDFRSYITSDKICAGSKSGTALCKGDTGGGLVFPEVERNVQRWYLRGVVSTAPSNGHKSNANSYTIFTQLLKHDHFVRKHLNKK